MFLCFSQFNFVLDSPSNNHESGRTSPWRTNIIYFLSYFLHVSFFLCPLFGPTSNLNGLLAVLACPSAPDKTCALSAHRRPMPAVCAPKTTPSRGDVRALPWRADQTALRPLRSTRASGRSRVPRRFRSGREGPGKGHPACQLVWCLESKGKALCMCKPNDCRTECGLFLRVFCVLILLLRPL